MTSEAHKRNPPGSERWGGKVRLVQISDTEVAAIETDGVGGPKLYFDEIMKGVRVHYAEAVELEKWRAARTDSQA